MERRTAEALDRHLTTDPREFEPVEEVDYPDGPDEDEQDSAPRDPLCCLACASTDPRNCSHLTYVTVYAVSRPYGGPEEGGWYYDAGEVVCVVPLGVASVDEVSRTIDVLTETYPNTGGSSSVLQREDYRIRAGSRPGRDYPEHTPRYA